MNLNYLRSKFSKNLGDLKFLAQNSFKTSNFLDPKFVWTQNQYDPKTISNPKFFNLILLNPDFFQPKILLNQKFLDPKFDLPKNYFLPKIVFYQILFAQKLFCTLNGSNPKLFRTKKFYMQNVFGPKLTAAVGRTLLKGNLPHNHHFSLPLCFIRFCLKMS